MLQMAASAYSVKHDSPHNILRVAMAALTLAAMLGASASDVEGPGDEARPATSHSVGRIAQRGVDPPDSPPPLQAPDEAWVEATLASLSLDEKIGQMLMPQWSSATAPSLLATYKVGGFIFLSTPSATVLNATNALQAASSVPLLFSIDCEAGPGARMADATQFPHNMALAASNSVEYARQQGIATARECRAVGVHIGFGPVLDVNTEPVNPVIGIRSYGDCPARIEELAAAYIQGAHDHGLLTTLKHFPGHGATDGDSHQSLQVVNITCDELRAVHTRPYAGLIQRGLGDLVMSAHVWYPCLDPGVEARPATLSHAALTGILREELGFEGAVVSDALNMSGLTVVSSGAEAAKVAVLAGVDILLMAPDTGQAFAGVRNAVLAGEIAPQRIDDAVRRILRLKSRVGLTVGVQVSETVRANTIAHPEHVAAAEAIGRAAISHARFDPGVAPIAPGQSVICFTLSTSTSIFYLHPASAFTNELLIDFPQATIVAVSTSVSDAAIASLVQQASTFDRVIVTSRLWKPTQPTAHVKFLKALIAQQPNPVIYCAFASAYHPTEVPGLRNVLATFTSHYAAQQEAARVLAGRSPVSPAGWPVAVPGMGMPPGLLLR